MTTDDEYDWREWCLALRFEPDRELICSRAKGHTGAHQTVEGTRWINCFVYEPTDD